MPRAINIPRPDLQIDFARALARIRKEHLQDALLETVRTMEISAIDNELAESVSAENLSILASGGLRGELLFPVPRILQKNPKLLAYYRLLLGYSQKEFYSGKCVGASFKKMEEEGTLPRVCEESLAALCSSLISAASFLLGGVRQEDLKIGLFHELSILTLGAQLRGGANVKKGADAIRKVFEIIQTIASNSTTMTSERCIEIRNAAGRKVFIEFAADPDIVIREEMRPNTFRNVIAIEIKGGKDFSNIHNRVGEAEKSHQKARQEGFAECWTVVNVDAIDLDMARRESPTTNRFYLLSQLESLDGSEFEDFQSRIISLAGIPTT
jgi:hypothetical protein